MNYHGPPRFFVFLIGAGVVSALLPFANMGHEVGRWWNSRAELTEAEQYRTYQTPWTNAPFIRFVDRIRESVPADAGVLLTPVGGDERLGRVRWHVFLNEAIYPRQAFVRRPSMASGTAMSFAPWVDYHTTLALVEPTAVFQPAVPFDISLFGEFPEEASVQEALVERAVEWEIRYFLDSNDPFRGALLLHEGKVFRSGGFTSEL